MMEQFWVIFWSAVGIIITGLATWLVTIITNWLNSKIKDKKVAKWATDITNIVFNAVSCVFQTFVETLKKQDKFDKQAQEEAKQKAYNIIMTQLTPELQQYITDNFGDMQQYIMNLIETTIYQLKK